MLQVVAVRPFVSAARVLGDGAGRLLPGMEAFAGSGEKSEIPQDTK
jgi:hypothetical protein